MIKKNLIKISVLCISILMFSSLYLSSYASTNENNERSKIVDIDLETGLVTRKDYIENNSKQIRNNRTEHYIPANVKPISNRIIVRRQR